MGQLNTVAERIENSVGLYSSEVCYLMCSKIEKLPSDFNRYAIGDLNFSDSMVRMTFALCGNLPKWRCGSKILLSWLDCATGIFIVAQIFLGSYFVVFSYAWQFHYASSWRGGVKSHFELE